jgi:hypothetical protein
VHSHNTVPGTHPLYAIELESKQYVTELLPYHHESLPKMGDEDLNAPELSSPRDSSSDLSGPTDGGSHPAADIELRSAQYPLPSEPGALTAPSTSINAGKKTHMHKVISAVTGYVEFSAGW